MEVVEEEKSEQKSDPDDDPTTSTNILPLLLPDDTNNANIAATAAAESSETETDHQKPEISTSDLLLNVDDIIINDEDDLDLDHPHVHVQPKSTSIPKLLERVAHVLVKGKALEPKQLQMCRESVKMISEIVHDLESLVQEAKWYLEASIDCLVYEYCGECVRKKALLQLIQLIIKSLHIWNCPSESSCKRKFNLANGQLVESTLKLEETISTVMTLFLQSQKDLQRLDHALRKYPEIVKFREKIPFKMEMPENVNKPEPDFEYWDSNEEISIKFVDSDMQFVIVKKESTTNGELITTSRTVMFKDLSEDYKAEIICIPIYQQIRTIKNAICNLQIVKVRLESLKISDLWETIEPNSFQISSTPFKTLENIVLAVLINKASGSVYSMLPLVKNLHGHISHLSLAITYIQVQAMGKKLIEDTEENRLNFMDRRKEFQRIELILDKIPDEYEIWDKPVTREYTSLIDKALRLSNQECLQTFMKKEKIKSPTSSKENIL